MSKNEIVIYDDYAEIILYNRKNEEKARTKVDLEDIKKICFYRWSLDGRGYVVNVKERIKLHRFIMNCPKDKYIDHINGDRLDNRKSNLRICNQQQNNMNHKVRRDNSSGVTGVYWYEDRNKWMVQIKYKGKTKNLGYFDKFEDAVKVRKQSETEIFKEYKRE